MSDPHEFSTYQFQDAAELCLQAGAGHDKQILLVPPLFDELNRMRRMLCDVMRQLNDLKIGSLLPDLPGSNESLYPPDKANLAVWREAIDKCAAQNGDIVHIASFRGGALIDNIGGNRRHWRLTPAKGKSLLRTLIRTQIASDKEMGISTTMDDIGQNARNSVVTLAGNPIGPALYADLNETVPAEPSDLRVMRLDSDSQPCDGQLPGTALWLRAEPDSDPVLSDAIAHDLAVWAT